MNSIFFKNLLGIQGDPMSFTTYENRRNPHVSIHRDDCNQLRKRGGQHNDGEIHYVNHPTYNAAREYAQKLNLPIKDCTFCKPTT